MSKNRKNQTARWIHTPLATGIGTSAFQAMKTTPVTRFGKKQS